MSKKDELNELLNDPEFTAKWKEISSIPLWARESKPNPVKYKKAVLMTRKIGSEKWEPVLDKDGKPITQMIPINSKNVRNEP